MRAWLDPPIEIEDGDYEHAEHEQRLADIERAADRRTDKLRAMLAEVVRAYRADDGTLRLRRAIDAAERELKMDESADIAF